MIRFIRGLWALISVVSPWVLPLEIMGFGLHVVCLIYGALFRALGVD